MSYYLSPHEPCDPWHPENLESIPLVTAQHVQTEAQHHVSTSGMPGHQRGFTGKGIVGVRSENLPLESGSSSSTSILAISGDGGGLTESCGLCPWPLMSQVKALCGGNT